MPLINKQEKRKYNYNDYLEWSEDERWEIIDGNLYAMSPAPSRLHQKISMRLVNEIYNEDDLIKVSIFEKLTIDLKTIFHG